MKKIIAAVLVVVLIGTVVWFYLFKFKAGNRIKAIDAVPANAILIIDVEDPFEQWNTITKGEIWQYLKTNPALSKIGNKIDSLNEELKSNQFLWNLVASRPVTVSAHKIRKDEFDLLYVIDLTKASKFSFVKDYLENLVGDKLKVTKRVYHSEEIVELDFKGASGFLYLYIKNNLIILSSTHVLIENSIDQLDEPVIARNLDFLEVRKQLGDDGVNLYLQHQYFKEYASDWMIDKDSESYEFIESLLFTAIHIDIDDQFLLLSGYSNLQDSLMTYAKIIRNSGQGKVELQRIVPENSMFFVSMGFDSFEKFYQNLETRIGESSEAVLYAKNKKKLEKYLGIDVEEDFLSWIGDEAGVLQINQGKKGEDQGYAFVLKANDLELAKEKLQYIKQQIKKKTPVKFKGINYKGYPINFLAVKGIFKVLLGKMFDKLDKPYYTIIGDYVVFSNHPGTLAQLITYQIEGKTLQNNEQFNAYFNQFESSSSLFLYINSKQMVPNSKEYLSEEYWQVVNKNKKYIESFPIAGLQIKPDGKLLTTSIMLNYMPKKERKGWSQLFLPIDSFELDTVVQKAPEKEESVQIDDIFPADLNDKKLTDSYANGQIKFEASIKNGLKDGSFKAYDSLGNVITKGRYKKNKKYGVWKYYTSEGDLIRKEKF